MNRTVTTATQIAYFTMEIAIEPEIPTYSGGLGILAGDTLRSAMDLELPIVAVSLVHRQGYFMQTLDRAGVQTEAPDAWDPARRLEPLGAKVVVPIEGREVWVGAWQYQAEVPNGARDSVIFLDTDLPENTPDDRRLTDTLYGGDQAYRLKQEVVLGIGGVRMLDALGYRVRKFHMNEGHAALLALELLRHTEVPEAYRRPGEAPYDPSEVRMRCMFTTHTPVGAGHDQYDYSLVERVLGDFIEPDVLRNTAGSENLDMTRLALNLSGYINGVARRHAETSEQMFGGYRISAITNGVHPHTWVSPELATLYDQHLPGWCNEPEILIRADAILPREAVWQAHQSAKQRLVDQVREQCGVQLDVDAPILGYARRMTAYKRPELIFTDLERLRAIGRQYGVQLVLAGKAHPRDLEGKQRIAQVTQALRALAPEVRGVFLPDYDMKLAQTLIPGVDCWLNTPQPPMEASGTSGMKAALNGVPNLSVLDGWWLEGWMEGVTGWAIGDGQYDPGEDDAAAFYDLLEQQVLPLYRGDRDAWITVMLNAIARNGSVFTSHRMMRRYAAEAYL